MDRGHFRRTFISIDIYSRTKSEGRFFQGPKSGDISAVIPMKLTSVLNTIVNKNISSMKVTETNKNR